ncbi:MAG: hypothetical protein IKE42_14980 [Aquamicrobium sp.]|nr:hypothetical protein [Aquamicrobium sp.]
MDRSRFFAALRSSTSGLFGTSLSQSQVAGIEAILDEAERVGLPLRQLSYVLATPYHETGGKMQPVTENLYYKSPGRIRAVWPSRFSSTTAAIPYTRNPQRLANKVYANRMGNGPEASGDGWKYRGRALPQITGKENYDKFSDVLGIDLVNDPDAANDADVSVMILMVGMQKGMFTDKKLSDFISGDRADYVGARVIINNDVKANGKTIAGYATGFERALTAADYTGQPPKKTAVLAAKPDPGVPVHSVGDGELKPPASQPQTATRQPGQKPGFFAALIGRLFGV